MTITVTDIGHNSNGTGTTLAVSVPVAGIAAGALVLVAVQEGSTIVNGSVADSAGNTYTNDANATSGSNGIRLQLYRSVIATGLTSGQSITYTKHANNHATGISAFYATSSTGWPASPLDLSPAGTTGTSTSPSITSGTPAAAGELFAAAAAWSATATFTQDSGHGWAVPFDVDTAQSSASIGGGNQVNAGTGALTFNPTLSASVAWGAVLVSYKPNAAFPVGTPMYLM